VYLRIIRPLPPTLEGFEVTRFALLGTYEVNVPLCDILVISGYAVPTDPPTPSKEAALKAVADAVVAKPARLTDHLDEPVTRSHAAPKKRKLGNRPKHR
jgi:hypothetical protein